MARTKQTARKKSGLKVVGGIRKASNSDGGVRAKRRWNPGTVALRMMRKEQKNTNIVGDKANFRRMVLHILRMPEDTAWGHGPVEVKDGVVLDRWTGRCLGKGDYRVSKEAMRILHAVAEQQLEELFAVAGDLAMISRNITLQPEHLEAAYKCTKQNYATSRGRSDQTILLSRGHLRDDAGRIKNRNDVFATGMFSLAQIERVRPAAFGMKTVERSKKPWVPQKPVKIKNKREAKDPVQAETTESPAKKIAAIQEIVTAEAESSDSDSD